MGNYDFDPSAFRRSPAFKRLSSKKAASPSADSPGKRFSMGSSRSSIFNQVQVAKSFPQGRSADDPRLARLKDAVDDNSRSTFALNSLSEVSREVQEANIGASAASVRDVDAAARLAEELQRRIVDNDLSAREAPAEMLNLTTVDRLLRS
jgi:hypothetical protein